MTNVFGRQFRFTTWGESHGPAVGWVVDGVPPGIALAESDIQPALDRRKPSGSALVTQRKEDDKVTILSGIFEGVTTGTPIAMMIENTDQRSRDYSAIKDRFRPGHADLVMMHKYGLRDYRGGGRTSARETAMRVAAGAVARRVVESALGDNIQVRGALVQMGAHSIDRDYWDWEEVARNDFFCPDAKTVKKWDSYLREIRKNGASVGACIEIIVKGVPAGWGAPIYGKLDADLASAMMSINAVKGVEIGLGMQAASIQGPENADQMGIGDDGQYYYK
ncbi:MAG: chorismate synthase, partial [Pseudomonadota bacterium]